jgi:hypothetical protein
MFVLNLYILDFEFVSTVSPLRDALRRCPVEDLGIRISCLCYINSTNSYVRIYKQIMQNKPNVKYTTIDLSFFLTSKYVKVDNW